MTVSSFILWSNNFLMYILITNYNWTIAIVCCKNKFKRVKIMIDKTTNPPMPWHPHTWSNSNTIRKLTLAIDALLGASSTSTHPFGLLVGWFLSCISSFTFFIALNNKTVVTHGKNTFMVTVVDGIPAATNHHDTFDRAVQFGILTRQQRSSTKGACLGIIHQATILLIEVFLLIGGQLF